MNTLKEALHKLNEEAVSLEEFVKEVDAKYPIDPYGGIALYKLKDLRRTKLFGPKSPFKAGGALVVLVGKTGFRIKALNNVYTSKAVVEYFFSKKALENLNKILRADTRVISYLKSKNMLPYFCFDNIYSGIPSIAGEGKSTSSFVWVKSLNGCQLSIDFNFNVYGNFIRTRFGISPKNTSFQPFDVTELDKQIDEIVSGLSEFDSFITTLNNALENFDTSILSQDSIHLNASDFKKIKLSDIYSEISKNPAPESNSTIWAADIKDFNEFLISNPYYHDLLINLTENDLADFIIKVVNALPEIRKNLITSGAEYYWTNAFRYLDFLTAWMKDTLELDMMSVPNIEKVFKLYKEVTFKNMVGKLDANTINVKLFTISLFNGSVILNEGITSISNLKIENKYYKDAIKEYVVLPSTLVGEIDFEKYIEYSISIVITPIKNEAGELISPFTVIDMLPENLKNRIYFLEE